MEAPPSVGGDATASQSQQAQRPASAGEAAPVPAPERLSGAVHQQLNLDSTKARALGLSKAIARMLEDIDYFSRSNTEPKWQDVLGQFSMMNMELFNIVEDIKKASKAFVVYPKNVNAEIATILPVMLSSKLLPEMEAEDVVKKEQVLFGMQNFPVPVQIEKIKSRIDMIGAACEAVEKVIADARKAYGLGSRQGPTLVPTLDKVQAAKIQEQENLLRAAVNFGEGLRIPSDQRKIPTSLPSHLADVLPVGDGAQSFAENPGALTKNIPPFSATNANAQGAGIQLIGRSIPSPSGVSGSIDNASTPPLPYANSPRSSTNIMNTPSPQQQTQQQHRQKIMQVSQHQQQLLAQQLRQPSPSGVLGQQQFQNRPLQSAHIQHNLAQSQINQGSHLRNQLGQLSGAATNALFNAAQTSTNPQMITSMAGNMQSQPMLSRMQVGLSGGHPQRNHPSQILSDQMFNMATSNPASMVGMQQQQQQHGGQAGFGSMGPNTQNLQGMMNLPNTTQNPNFGQQRQQNSQ